ncbi:PAS domain S-box protein [Moritella sp.]|uniref:PAS domain S-box protein n=1 Tax=Moritella sp. TaxID=78556 RepID=UPI0025CB9713|nr:PAS domain S-box protein [Moritella sp.]MCJ8351439.1 PAS domain S-box protein [Moritella sp.]
MRTEYSGNNMDITANHKKFSKDLAYWLLPCWLVIFIIMVIHYSLNIAKDKQYALHNEQVIVELIEKLLNESLNSMTSDALMLSYIAKQISIDHSNTAPLTNYFIELSKNDDNYEQIRFIDIQGYERIRVNNISNKIYTVDSQDLQNKSKRYYFQKTMQLSQGNVYISPMDLNIEAGQIQQPLNPTIRIGVPVFNVQDEKIGAIILNYKGRKLINRLLHISPNFIEHLYILNAEGVAIIQPVKSALSTLTSKNKSPATPQPFQFNTSKQLSDELLELMSQAHQGQILLQDSYITFTQAFSNRSGRWTIASIFPKQRFNLARIAFADNYMLLYITLTLVLSFLIFLFRYHYQQTNNLREQQAYDKQFRLTLENIQFIAVSINSDGIITFCNDFFLNLVGYQKHQVIGKCWVDTFIPQKLQQQAAEALKQALVQELDQTKVETVVQTNCGEVVLVSWSSTYSKAHGNNLATATFIGEDVTEHKMEQDQLQRLSHAVEQSHNSVMITEITGEIIYVNPVFCELTGYQKHEVLGITPKFLQSGEMPVVGYDSLRQTIQRGDEWRGEFHNKKKNGDLFWERARISPVKDSAGNALYFVAVKQDITKEKQLAHEMQEQEALHAKQDKLAAVGKVVNMIAHDLRNPLSSIKMVLQIYARKEQDELFDISLEQVRYMEAILEDLLSYSRPEQFKPEWLDLNKLVEFAVNSQRRLAKEKDVAIEFSYPHNLPTVYADPIKLRQALQNLIVNAIQAAETSEQACPLVTVTTNILLTDSNSVILIDITNNGKSIDPCMVSKVFEPFYTTKAKGTGLGLAIVQKIIESHKGSVRLKLINPIGTLAQIQLPLSSHISAPISPIKDVVNEYV